MSRRLCAIRVTSRLGVGRDGGGQTSEQQLKSMEQSVQWTYNIVHILCNIDAANLTKYSTKTGHLPRWITLRVSCVLLTHHCMESIWITLACLEEKCGAPHLAVAAGKTLVLNIIAMYIEGTQC